MAAPLTKDKKRRMKAVDISYRAALKAAHDKYNKAYDAAMKKHGLSIEKLKEHFGFPVAFHQDLAAARESFLSEHTAANNAKLASVSQLPRRG